MRPVHVSNKLGPDQNSPAQLERPVIAILLFDGVEVLDFAGPYEVFAAARDESGERYTEVFTVADRREVKCHGGLRVITEATCDACPPYDVLIVPGGPGARERSASQESIIHFIQKQKGNAKLIASVCTGSFLLARAGLLEGRRATTHPNRLELFRDEFPTVRVEQGKIIDEGQVITAGGVSSGIDLALYFLERWCGRDARLREARRLDGPW
jgi:transcriptional regulator GlxA family with amidase domain